MELELLVAVNTNEVGWVKTKHIVAEQEAQCWDKKSKYDFFFDFFGCLIFSFRERAELVDELNEIF